jgi:hypothetical protein
MRHKRAKSLGFAGAFEHERSFGLRGVEGAQGRGEPSPNRALGGRGGRGSSWGSSSGAGAGGSRGPGRGVGRKRFPNPAPGGGFGARGRGPSGPSRRALAQASGPSWGLSQKSVTDSSSNWRKTPVAGCRGA